MRRLLHRGATLGRTTAPSGRTTLALFALLLSGTPGVHAQNGVTVVTLDAPDARVVQPVAGPS